VVGEFGQLWGVPQWVMDLSPFTHSPMLPGPDPQLWGMAWLTVAAAVLLAGGSVAFRRRDLAANG
jgi:ABC-2 type transport system permease protein